MRGITRSRLALVLVAVVGLAAVVAPAATASRDNHHGRDLRGEVVTTHRHPKTVTVATRSNGDVDFRVTDRTRYEHINGFSALKPGLEIEVHAQHRNGGWIATKIDRRGTHS